jgi:hypothetical protein
MFDSAKELLNSDINPVNIKKFLAMEVEIHQLKELLEKEVKLKEFMLQELDVKKIVSKTISNKSNKITENIDTQSHQQQKEESYSPENDRRKSDSRRDDDNLRINDDRRISFGRRKADNTEKDLNALPAYDLGLIQTLEKSHKELLFIYESIMSYARQKNYKIVSEQLHLFSEQFTNYFYIVDQQLYSYLRVYINIKQPKRKKAFSALNLEMKNLYLSIYYSLNQSPNIPMSDKNHEGFISEFDLLGEQLKERFEREEKVLMKIYEESHEVENISFPEAIVA